MPRSRPRRTRIRLLASGRAELQRSVAARTSTQQAAYRAEIILRVAEGQTDSTIAREMGLAVRTVFVLEQQGPGAVRGRPSRTGPGSSQQKPHRRHPQA